MKRINDILIIFFVSILLYSIFKLFFNLTKNTIAYYSPYIVLSIILLILAILFKFSFKEKVEYFVIVLFSVFTALYAFEGYLIKVDSLDYKNLKKAKLLKKRYDKNYDLRSLSEIYKDEKKNHKELSIDYSPSEFIKKKTDIIPVSGRSNVTTIMNCNEMGYYPIYKSDRFGFNNPDYEWDQTNVEYLLIGDSLTLGNCVNRPEDLASNLRNLSKKSVINLGQGGNGPLLGLASLKEYIQPNIKNIIWLFSEANDFKDLEIELTSVILKSYLESEKFSQNLKENQKKIDYLVQTNLEEDLKKVKEKRKTNLSIINFIKLTNLRNRLYRSEILNDYTLKAFDYETEIFTKDEIFSSKIGKILLSAKDLSIKNNSNLYFINLPNYTRYGVNYKFKDSRNLKDFVESLDIKFIDMHNEVFLKQKNPLDLFPLNLPGHYNALAYRKISEVIYDHTK